ncbi:Rrp15p-domain-containing protein [Scleroderma yunnanense]
MPPHKRTREDDDGETELSHSTYNDSEAAQSSDEDTNDEIAAQPSKRRATSKRKRRATGPSQFGATLQSLLKTETTSTLPLSLKPSLARERNDAKLELKAKKMMLVERKEKEDRGRIRDVIEGWGAEGERSLRKVAQRGVVKLFNTIQQSQVTAATVEAEAKAARGSGKPSLPTPSLGRHNTKGKQKDNLLGRGKTSIMDQDNFFDVIRSGGIVSKV